MPRHASSETSIPCSLAVGTSGSAGSRVGIIAASRRTWPGLTGAASAAGSCTTASTWPPSRLGTTCAAPNGTSTTFTPAALEQRHDEMCVWLPMPELPTVIAWARLCVGHEVGEVLPLRVGAHRDHRRLDEHARHRVERLVVEGELAGVVGGRDRVRVPHQRVAVGLLRRDVAVADGAAGAGAVDHDHALAELLRHALGEQARGHVGRRAGGKEHRDLEWPFCGKAAPARAGREATERKKRSEGHRPRQASPPPPRAVPRAPT